MIAWLNCHPSDLTLLTRLFFGGNRKSAYTTTARLRKKRKIRYVWNVQLTPEGRPSYVYCNWLVKCDTIRGHELPLSYLAAAYRSARWVRGYSRVNQDVLPDAEMTLERLHYVEYYTDLQTEKQVRERLKVYRDITDPLLVVTLTEERKRELMSWANEVEAIAAFATLKQAVEQPWEAIWETRGGEKFPLKKPQEKIPEKQGTNP